MHITLKQLKAFRAVANLGQVRLAAQELKLSQPATSMAIAELENQLGCPLFDRTGNKLMINNQGKLLIPLASELLDRSLEVENLFKDSSPFSSGHLKLGATMTIGNYLLPSLLENLNKKHPQLRITLQIKNTQNIIEKMSTLELDIACVEGTCVHNDLNVFPWHEDEMVIACAPTHPLAGKSDVSFEELSQEQWILREPESGTRNIFDYHIGKNLHPLRIKMELSEVEALKSLVRANLGISYLSKLSINKELGRGDLCVTNTNHPPMKRQLSILLHKKKYHTETMSLFLSLIGWQTGGPPNIQN